MRWDVVLLGATVLLLVAADLLTFHDLFEPHTIRDWLVLAATAVVLIHSLRMIGTPRRPATSSEDALRVMISMREVSAASAADDVQASSWSRSSRCGLAVCWATSVQS